jgi:hypothetical protein
MAQTIQILRTNTNVAPTTLLPGALSAELGPQTKLWIGSGSGNRLLLSSDPADAAAAGGAYLKLAGGTLTGPLVLAADPSLALGAATKQYTDAKDALRLALTGGALSGPLTLAADPSANLGAATKQYVDAAAAASAAADTVIRNTYLAIAGGTLTGALTLAADPAAALQAATRQYVDGKAGATVATAAPSSPKPGQLWWDANGGQLYVYYDDGNTQQWVPASTVPGLSVPIAIAQGGTGAVTAPAALVNLGIIATAPTTQSFTGGSGTYTTPAGVKWIEVHIVGGGGGGGGSGQGGASIGGNGGNTTFGGMTAGGGGGGSGAGGAATATTGVDFFVNAGSGGYPASNISQSAGQVKGGDGGSSFYGGAGMAVVGSFGNLATTGSGSGGAGGGATTAAPGTVFTGGGGAAGSYGRKIIGNPAATYPYAVGALGAGGAAGTNGFAGGNGGSGSVLVIEHYNY